MGKRDIENLKHKNPEVRKKAIRTVAKSKDLSALNLLISMAQKDPDPDLRQLATQAAGYIKKNAKPAEDDGKVEVSEKNSKQAQSLLSSAQSFLMANDSEKLVNALKKALKANPNLKDDGYFISLAEQATGAEGQEAVAMLDDRAHISKLARSNANTQKSQDQQQHLDEVSRTSWGAVGFDFGLMWVLGLLGTAFILFLVIYQSGDYYEKLKQNRNDYAAAIRAGNLDYEQDTAKINSVLNTSVSAQVNTFWRNGDPEDPQDVTSVPGYSGGSPAVISGKVVKAFCPEGCTPAATGGSAKKSSVMVPGNDFFNTVEDWRKKPISDIIVPSVAAAFLLPALMLVTSLIVHIFSSFIFRGWGHLPNTIDKITTTVMTRLVMLLIFMVITLFVGFMFNGLVLPAQLAAGGVAALTVLNLVSVVSKAYKLSFPLALVSTLIGLVPIAALIGFALIQTGVVTL